MCCVCTHCVLLQAAEASSQQHAKEVGAAKQEAKAAQQEAKSAQQASQAQQQKGRSALPDYG